MGFECGFNGYNFGKGISFYNVNKGKLVFILIKQMNLNVMYKRSKFMEFYICLIVLLGVSGYIYILKVYYFLKEYKQKKNYINGIIFDRRYFSLIFYYCKYGYIFS